MRIFSAIIVSLFVLSSCRTLDPKVMFKTDKNYSFDVDSTATQKKEYHIAPGDRLEMHFYTIEGFHLVDVTSTTVQGATAEAINYLVEEDGQVKLPVIGKVQIGGKTVIEAEHFLEEKYSTLYVNPFILLRVSNRLVYVFFGDNGRGITVNLQNDNTNIIEAIAMAGGITENSKAWRIKIIRGDLHNPKVYLVDLSTIDGLKSSDLRIHSNDIIYVEATPNYKQKLFAQFIPIIGILTSVLLIVNLIKK